MFLHLGENVVVPLKDVIGIFDMETSTYSSDSMQFLRLAEEDGFVEKVSSEPPKAFVIAEVEKKSKLSVIALIPVKSTAAGISVLSAFKAKLAVLVVKKEL